VVADLGGDTAVLGAGEDHAEAPGRGCGWRGGGVRSGAGACRLGEDDWPAFSYFF
jgi:hypothetical protein